MGAIKIDKKEKVNDFNQLFLNVLTKLTTHIVPAQSLSIDYYSATLIPSIGMFVKWVGRDTSAPNFD